MDYILRKITLPTTDCVTTAVAGLWRDCFGQEEVDCTLAQFAGKETDFNIDTLFVLECNGSLGATEASSRSVSFGRFSMEMRIFEL